MTDLYPAAPLSLAFLIASLVLAITPGPGVIYIVTRSIVQGRAAGLASVAGVALGNLGNAIGASLGLAALLMVSSLAFAMVKYTGAIYLAYLGIQTLRPSPLASDRTAPAAAEPGRIFRDGFIVALLNPKTALFFAAFIPQFLSLGASPILQSVLLAFVFVTIAAATDSVYAVAAGAIAPVLRAGGVRILGRILGGGVLLGLGILTALAGSDGSA